MPLVPHRWMFVVLAIVAAIFLIRAIRQTPETPNRRRAILLWAFVGVASIGITGLYKTRAVIVETFSVSNLFDDLTHRMTPAELRAKHCH